MRQVSLQPAGCQYWNSFVSGTSQDYFVYCSTLAIYVRDRYTFRIKKILTSGDADKNLTAFCWCPTNQDMVASCAHDCKMRVHNIQNGAELFNGDMQKDVARCMAWSPLDNALIAYSTDQGKVRFCDISKGMSYVLNVCGGTSINVVRWHPTKRGMLAMGTATGMTVVLRLEGSKVLSRQDFQKEGVDSPVVDLQWAPHDSGSGWTYLLIGHDNHKIVMAEEQTMQEVSGVNFEEQAGGLATIAWDPTQVGRFVTTSKVTGQLRIWNMAESKPVELIKVHDAAFKGLTFFPDASTFVGTFKDGFTGVYDLQSKRWKWRSQSGHAETIFDCRFHPRNPDHLASCSFDGTVKACTVYWCVGVTSLLS
jgi:WD40 repeat protein